MLLPGLAWFTLNEALDSETGSVGAAEERLGGFYNTGDVSIASANDGLRVGNAMN